MSSGPRRTGKLFGGLRGVRCRALESEEPFK